MILYRIEHVTLRVALDDEDEWADLGDGVLYGSADEATGYADRAGVPRDEYRIVAYHWSKGHGLTKIDHRAEPAA